MTVRFSVTIRQVRDDGSEAPLEQELAAALAAPAEQFAGLAAWAAGEAGYLDHGEREKVIGEEGRELQRRLLQATFDIDSAREERAEGVTSAAGIRHGIVEDGHGRGVTSVFGPVRVTRKAYRNRREPNLYPADARQVLPGDPYSLGMRALAAFHLAAGGFGQAQEVIEARTGVTVGRAQLAGLAEDLAAWTDDFYEQRSRDAEEDDQPDTDVIMMQGDGKGIAMRPEHRRNAGKDDGTRPGISGARRPRRSAAAAPRLRGQADRAGPGRRRPRVRAPPYRPGPGCPGRDGARLDPRCPPVRRRAARHRHPRRRRLRPGRRARAVRPGRAALGAGVPGRRGRCRLPPARAEARQPVGDDQHSDPRPAAGYGPGRLNRSAVPGSRLP